MKRLRLAVTAAGRALLAVAVLALGVAQVRSCATPPADPADRLRAVTALLTRTGRALREEDGAARMQRVFPTGGCFLPTLHGLAWANVARATPDAAVRARACDEIAFAIDATTAGPATAPFTATQVERGVFWSGQRNLLLAELLSLTPADRRPRDHVAEFHERSAALAAAFLASPTRHLDTYPSGCWPADQAAALASLAAHDRLFRTDHARAAREWLTWTSAHLDPRTDLPAGEIDGATGRVLQPARGCGTSWLLAVLPGVDEAASRRWYARYVETHGRERLGFRAFAEWPAGVAGFTDADTGPIVAGIGTAATGIGLAAARANGDARRAADVWSLAQMLGMPWTSRDGTETTYLAGRLPMAEAFLAYGLSIPLPDGVSEDARGALDLLRDRWPLHAAATLVQLAAVALLVHDVRRAARARRTPAVG